MSERTNKKIKLGQFYTEKNIFLLCPFIDWWIAIENKGKVLEPFAGANNIINSLIKSNLIRDDEFASFDIEPQNKNVIKNDSIKKFPKNYKIAITNPPYISKNSATKRNFKINFNGYSDLYEICLKKCLDNCEYVAAIIPESFITTKRFKDRLDKVISLTYNDMFSDTEHPVCLALFSKNKTESFQFYRNDLFLGNSKELNDFNNYYFNDCASIRTMFNNQNGQIGLVAIDNTESDSIKFVDVQEIGIENVKKTSRARTIIKIDLDLSNEDIKHLINKCNNLLFEYRVKTHDFFLTSFKGIRKDGLYRRRLDYETANKILLKALCQIKIK